MITMLGGAADNPGTTPTADSTTIIPTHQARFEEFTVANVNRSAIANEKKRTAFVSHWLAHRNSLCTTDAMQVTCLAHSFSHRAPAQRLRHAATQSLLPKAGADSLSRLGTLFLRSPRYRRARLEIHSSPLNLRRN